MLQDVGHPLAQLAREVVEDKMGVGLGHVGDFILHVMPQHHVLKAEVNGGPDWEVAQNESIGHAAVLVQQYQVCEVLIEAQIHEVLHHIGASVDPLSVGENNRHFLQELHQPVGGVSGGRDEDLRVRVHHVGILVVNVGPRDHGVHVVRLQFLLEFLLLPEQLRGEPALVLLCLQYLLLLLAFLLQFGLSLESEQILSALSDVLPQHAPLDCDCCCY